MAHISVAEHRATLSRLVGVGAPERLPFDRLVVGRRLAADLVAVDDLPRFDGSAMDGYAVHLGGDGRRAFDVVGDVPAGAAAEFTVGPGQAARIMTGARVPAGASAVVPVERTDAAATGAAPARVVVAGDIAAGDHIRGRGEEIRAGAVVAPAGTRVDAALLALGRSAGCVEVEVHPQTRVAVVATGAELTGPGDEPGLGEIHESNSEMIAALAAQAGCLPTRVRRCPDEPMALQELFAEFAAADDVDLVVTTGGVSKGAYEVVRQVGTALGTFEFVHLAMQPGGPQGVGRIGSTPVVCLPGTPVGAYVSFTMLLRPALDARHGHPRREAGSAAYAGPTLTTRTGSVQFLSAVLGPDGTVAPAPGLHLRALARADAMIEVPEDVDRLAAGDLVTVHPLRG